jgi:hypothetical protein
MVKLNLETGEISELFDKVFKDPKLTAKHREAWIFQNGFMDIEEVRNAKPISEYVNEIQEIMNDFQGLITAWNRAFDSAFLEHEGFNLGSPVECPMKKVLTTLKSKGLSVTNGQKHKKHGIYYFRKRPKLRSIVDSMILKWRLP